MLRPAIKNVSSFPSNFKPDINQVFADSNKGPPPSINIDKNIRFYRRIVCLVMKPNFKARSHRFTQFFNFTSDSQINL